MTTKTENVARQSQSFPAWAFRWRTLFLLVGLALLLWLGLKAWRIGRAAQSLMAQQTTAETLLANGLTNIDPDDAASMARTVRADFVVLRDETAFLMPLMPRLGWVPDFGPMLVSAPQLVEMGDAGTETAVLAVESLKPLLTILQSESGEDQLPQLITALSDARPGLAEAAVSLDRVAVAYAQLENLDQFPDRLQPLFAQADKWLPIAQDSLAVVQILPDIMGVNGRRTYLLLAQNEDELRATGGFISGVGTLIIEKGDIQSLTFQDASSFDTEHLLANSEAYDFPPQPLYELMGLEYLLIRDANYWPDFPHSAQTAIELYNRVEPTTKLDGVIAIDQQFMSLLVAATGPVNIPESNTTITAQNTVQNFRDAFNIQEGQTVRDWLQNRKAFLLTFATAILDKVQSDFSTVDPITFTKNIHEALSRRHLQLYMVDETETAVLDQLNWDGRLENPPGQDFLLILDSNIGYNKSNMFVQRHYEYDISLNPNAPANATLAISYNHTNMPEDSVTCEQGISYKNAPSYQEIAERCYFNFLRIYTPADSTLTEATAHIVLGENLVSESTWQSEAATSIEFASYTTFSNFLMVPRGDDLTTTYKYNVPQTIIQQINENEYSYTLWIRKQAGHNAELVKINITIPEGSTILETFSSNEATISSNGNTTNFSLELHADTQITIRFSQ